MDPNIMTVGKSISIVVLVPNLNKVQSPLMTVFLAKQRTVWKRLRISK